MALLGGKMANKKPCVQSSVFISGGDGGAMICGEPCMGGGGYGPRLPLAADWDGVLWLFFCVLVACGVGDYFVAFSLVADSVCELCVVIAGW